MTYNRGSVWNMWDLHVHTPCSIINHYGGDNAENWERFITDLEGLDEHIKVLGINDYLFIDGYKKIREYRANGRLTNIDCVMPVVELRLNRFGGPTDEFKRLNFHVIFSEDVAPEDIERDFILSLSNKYQLTGEQTWNRALSKGSLISLGQMVKASMPGDKVPNVSDLEAGFNSFNVDMDDVMKLLERDCFKDKALTALGRNEWEAYRWDQHIAEKRTLINSVNVVFTASHTVEDYLRGKKSLSTQGVEPPLIHASDSHHYSTATLPERLGRCFTWIKANTTFEGLRQALREPDNRIWVGDQLPPKLRIVQQNKTKYIDNISIHRTDNGKPAHAWFNNYLELNPDLVAVIGNKGMGKSALADIIGLLGDTKNAEDFSFLRKEKFRKGNLSHNFEAEIEWLGGTGSLKKLSENPGANTIERVKYIPQQYLEKLCNNDDGKFESELKSVIFSHVRQEDRLGKLSLDALIEYKTETLDSQLAALRTTIHTLNTDIVEMESMATDKNVSTLWAMYQAKKEELRVHWGTKPPLVTKPSDDIDEEAERSLNILNERRAQVDAQHREKINKLKEMKLKSVQVERLIDKIIQFQVRYEKLVLDCQEEAEALGVNVRGIVVLTTKLDELHQLKQSTKDEVDSLLKTTDVNVEGSTAYELQYIDSQIQQARQQVGEKSRQYQLYIEQFQNWNHKRKSIIGAADEEGSLLHFRAKLHFIHEALSPILKAKYKERQETSSKIYESLVQQREVYRRLYKPVQQFIDEQRSQNSDINLNFQVTITEKGFQDGLLSLINQGARGVFHGAQEGAEALAKLVDETEFDVSEPTLSLIDTILVSLSATNDNGIRSSEEVKRQLKKSVMVEQFYNYLFTLEYLTPTYSLQLGGKDLGKLSPGEKGAVLLMFYLLVDPNDIPLVIDQPEENLDNQSVYQMLVPCIKTAKDRRQIVIVTHNPNLAVVCDAEQIICSRMNKTTNEITYECGAIEDSRTNQAIIDILEGTMPAFRNRDKKYYVK